MGIAKKIQELIGDDSVQSWSERHGLPKQTVHEWIKNDRVPRGASLNQLCQATGKSKDWWLNESSEYSIPKPTATSSYAQTAREYTHTLYIEHYPDVRAAAGPGQVTSTDQISIMIAVNASEWRARVGLNPNNIKVITIYGDSMVPTLCHGDQVLVDIACSRFIDDAMYAIVQNDLVRVKRIKLNLDGSIMVKSDNENGFPPEKYTQDEALAFNIVGKVLPFKFGQFKI